VQFKKIKSITAMEEPKDIYHLTIKKNHNFFGNGVCLHNCSYRGDCGIKLYNLSDTDYVVKKGSAVAQLIVYELVTANVEWVTEIETTERGEKGFGSSNR